MKDTINVKGTISKKETFHGMQSFTIITQVPNSDLVEDIESEVTITFSRKKTKGEKLGEILFDAGMLNMDYHDLSQISKCRLESAAIKYEQCLQKK